MPNRYKNSSKTVKTYTGADFNSASSSARIFTLVDICTSLLIKMVFESSKNCYSILKMRKIQRRTT